MTKNTLTEIEKECIQNLNITFGKKLCRTCQAKKQGYLLGKIETLKEEKDNNREEIADITIMIHKNYPKEQILDRLRKYILKEDKQLSKITADLKFYEDKLNEIKNEN